MMTMPTTSHGGTAEFTRNVLHVLNRELDVEFDVAVLLAVVDR